MSKVILRFIVVIAIVVVSVAIAVAILNKPNYNQTVYKTWQSATVDSRFDLEQKVNTTLNSGLPTFNGHTLRDLAPRVDSIFLISQYIDDYIVYLLNYTKYSKNVKEKDAKTLNKSLSKYYDLRLSDDGTGYWIDYYYDFVQDMQTQNDNDLAMLEAIVNRIYDKWIIQSQQGASLILLLEDYVERYVFDNNAQFNIKNTLLDFSAHFASVYVCSENLNTFEANHLAEFTNMKATFGPKLSDDYKALTTQDILLVQSYHHLTSAEIRDFISSTNKSQFIQDLKNQENVNQAKVDALTVLKTYLGV